MEDQGSHDESKTYEENVFLGKWKKKERDDELFQKLMDKYNVEIDVKSEQNTMTVGGIESNVKQAKDKLELLLKEDRLVLFVGMEDEDELTFEEEGDCRQVKTSNQSLENEMQFPNIPKLKKKISSSPL